MKMMGKFLHLFQNKKGAVNPLYTEELLIGIELEWFALAGWHRSLNLVEFKECQNESQRAEVIYRKFQNFIESSVDSIWSVTRDSGAIELRSKNLLKVAELNLKIKKLVPFVSSFLNADPKCGIHLSISYDQEIVKNNLRNFWLFCLLQEEFLFNMSGRDISKYSMVTPLANHSITDSLKYIIEGISLNVNKRGLVMAESYSYNKRYNNRIELRWFNSSTKAKEVKGFIELIDAIFNYVSNNKPNNNLDYFFTYISCHKEKYKNLIWLIKKRKFYRIVF